MDSATYPAIGASGELAGAWRRAALVAVCVAAVELVALLVVGVALLGGPIAHLLHGRAAVHATAAGVSAAGTATAPAVKRPAAPAPPELARARTRVLVLNGNGVSGAAHAAAVEIAARGYPSPATGNADRADYATSFVLYRPGYEREARRLARDASVAHVAPLDGRPAALHGAKLILILGR